MRDRTDTVDQLASVGRRRFLRGSAALLATAAAGVLPLRARSAEAPAGAVTPDRALEILMEGNARYVRGETRPHDHASARAALAKRQSPHSVVLSCSDSRVAPELAFDQGRGDLFVVRVAGNFVDEYGLASIEYALRFLGASLVLVLGHTGCGAVDAAIKTSKGKAELPGHLPELIAEIEPAVAAAKGEQGDLLANAIRANVRLNVAELAAARPIVAAAVESGKVKVVGGVYDLETGKVALLT